MNSRQSKFAPKFKDKYLSFVQNYCNYEGLIFENKDTCEWNGHKTILKFTCKRCGNSFTKKLYQISDDFRIKENLVCRRCFRKAKYKKTLRSNPKEIESKLYHFWYNHRNDMCYKWSEIYEPFADFVIAKLKLSNDIDLNHSNFKIFRKNEKLPFDEDNIEVFIQL